MLSHVGQTKHDSIDDVRREIELSAEIGLALPVRHAYANRLSKIPRDRMVLRCVRVKEAECNRPPNTLFLSHRLEVREPIVELVSVNVVEDSAGRDRTDARKPDHAMHEPAAETARMREPDPLVGSRMSTPLRADELSPGRVPPWSCLGSSVGLDDTTILQDTQPRLLDGASNIVHGRRIVPVSHAHALAWPKV